MGYKITIDGPSGTGKGYVATEIAKKLNILNIDTGAMYRAFGLYCKENNIDIQNNEQIKSALKKVEITFEYGESIRIYLNGIDVSQDIRSEGIGAWASKVAAIKEVRQVMVEKQRMLANGKSLVMEGRDIGSVVFKDAELKIFLTASVETRAKRKYDVLIAKNKEVTYEQTLEDIKRRDYMDSTRKDSPLQKTEDMILIDTTNLTKQETVEKVLELIKERNLV